MSVSAPLSPSDSSSDPQDRERVFAASMNDIPWRGRWGKVLFVLLAVILAGLRTVYVHHYGVDSDEPQHLHVIWAWTKGLVQYRDVFDNHTPLFQLLCAPVMAMFGETPNIIILMRHMMLPFFLLDLWCVYLITKRMTGRRAAWWTVVAVAFFPIFLLTSAEFRTDDMWAAVWIASMAAIACGKWGRGRAFATGVLLGACFATSMKTSLLFGSLVIALAMIAAILRFRKEPLGFRLSTLWWALAGMVLIPGVLVAWFAAHDALHQMYYCVIEHNTALATKKISKFAFKRVFFPAALIGMPFVAAAIFRHRADRKVAFIESVMLLTSVFYYTALRSLWPVVTIQDYLPLIPIAFVAVAPTAVILFGKLASWHRNAPKALLSGIVLAEIAGLLLLAPPWEDRASSDAATLAAILKYTDPGDYVMDGKGESIFRRRPFYWVMETLTNRRMEDGSIKDELPPVLIKTKTCFLLRNRMPAKADAWLDENYIANSEKLHVAGKRLGLVTKPEMHFSTEIDARYRVLVERGSAAGTLDGKPFDGVVDIPPGEHVLSLPNAFGRVTIAWAQAVDRGFQPAWRPLGWKPKREKAKREKVEEK